MLFKTCLELYKNAELWRLKSTLDKVTICVKKHSLDILLANSSS